MPDPACTFRPSPILRNHGKPRADPGPPPISSRASRHEVAHLFLGLSLTPSDVGGRVSLMGHANPHQDLAGRAQIALQGLGRHMAALRSHSTVAWREADQVRRCRAPHTPAGRGSLSACAPPRVGGCIDPVPRRRSRDATHRKDQVGRSPKALLLPVARPPLRTRGAVYPAQPR